MHCLPTFQQKNNIKNAALISGILHITLIICAIFNIFSFDFKKKSPALPITVEIIQQQQPRKIPVKKINKPIKPKKTLKTPPKIIKTQKIQKLNKKAVGIPLKNKKNIKNNKKKSVKKSVKTHHTFNRLLKDLVKEKPNNTPPMSMTMQEFDIIRKQFHAVWRIPIGLKGIQQYKVKVLIIMNPDRTVKSVQLLKSSSSLNSSYSILAESVLRAVNEFKYKPLLFPINKYKIWNEVEMTFDPSSIL